MTATLISFLAPPLSAQQPMERPATRIIDQLQLEFSRGHAPGRRELLGHWILVKQVDTERFLRGTDGPEHVLADELGVRDSSAGHPYYWEMRIASGADGRLRAASNTPWASPEVSILAFERSGAVTFAKDYGGDASYFYRCRLAGRDWLICLLKGKNPQHGVEFRRQMAAADLSATEQRPARSIAAAGFGRLELASGDSVIRIGGTDSWLGVILSAPRGLRISFDIGHMAGLHISPRRKPECIWFRVDTLNGRVAHSCLLDDRGQRLFVITIPGNGSDPWSLPANFWAHVREDADVAEVTRLARSYKPAQR